MQNVVLISELKNIILSKEIEANDDLELVTIYLKLGNAILEYLKSNKNKDLVLSSIFKNLKNEFAKIRIYKLKSIESLYQLAIDYHRLDFVKTLLKQISIDNKILIINDINSNNLMIKEIKNSIIESYYMDTYAKNYYYRDLTKKEKDDEWVFKETMNLLNIFKANISSNHS